MNKNELKTIFIASWHWLSWDSVTEDNWAINNEWIREIDVNRRISNEIIELLKNSNLFWVNIIPVWIKERYSLQQKINTINKYCLENWLDHTNSILISIHQNSFNEDSANWIELWYYMNSKVSSRLALDLIEWVSELTSLKTDE